MTILFIGGGNMASAMIGGLLQQGTAASEILAVDIAEAQRARLRERFGIATFSQPREALAGAQIVLLAVKPQQMREVAVALAAGLSEQLVISIAAGIRTGDLSRWLGGYGKIVRAMPNTPALLRMGITGLYALPHVGASDKASAERLLGSVGKVVWLEDEAQLDTVTAVSGSGPAYVFYFIEALEEAALQLGVSAEVARTLALQTFLGATSLAASSDEPAATLRARVTSKGGTTERAIARMEAQAMKTSFVEAVRAAAERSRELGDELGK